MAVQTPHEMDPFLGDYHVRRLTRYQKNGVKKAKDMNFRVINALDCGLGKTDQSIAQIFSAYKLWFIEYTERKQHKKEEDLGPPKWTTPIPILMVCPALKDDDWYNASVENLQFPKEKVCILKDVNRKIKSKQNYYKKRKEKEAKGEHTHHQEKKRKIEEEIQPLSVHDLRKYSIIIVSYQGCSQYFNLLSQIEFHTILLDESQVVMNIKSKMAISLSNLMKDTVRYRIMNTANPMQKYPIDIFIQLHLLDKYRFPDWLSFAKQYCWPEKYSFRGKGGKEQTITQYKKIKNEDQWIEMLSSYMIQVKSEDAKSELPSRPEATRTLNMIHCQDEEDLQKLKAIRTEYEEKLEQEADDAQLLKLYGEMSRKMMTVKTKMVVKWLKLYLKREIRKDPSTRFILFAHHRRFTHQLETLCEDMGLSHILVDGKTQHKQAKFDEFQLGNTQVINLSMKACGHGANLQEANRVVFCELPPSSSDLQQGEARSNRIGQKRQVQIEYLVLEDSTDKSVLNIIKRKMKEAAKVMESARTFKEGFDVARVVHWDV